ncbi:left-handed beta-roll domain-containing protein [Mannheimia haemolytica]|uniref:left-handed beta-roll domain-containing protein n=1 Tax=Mannheimia haemolytica TaxID=75985 RepID=UPI0038F67093
MLEANATAIHSTAIGAKSQANGDNSTAIGYEAKTSRPRCNLIRLLCKCNSKFNYCCWY